MNQTDHPTSETILLYLEAPDEGEFSALRRHLATCQVCRLQTTQLRNIQHGIRRHIPDMHIPDMESSSAGDSREGSASPKYHCVEQYIDGTLPAQERLRAEELMANDPTALRSALHYATHSRAMQRQLDLAVDSGVTAAMDRPGRESNQWSLWHWIRSLFNWSPPAWIAVPVTAVLVLVVTLMVNPVPHSGPPPALTIASYRDNPVIRFSDINAITPGVGFFSNAKQTVRPYANIYVTISEADRLTIKWPAIESVSDYTMDLYLIIDGKKSSVAKLNTRQTVAVFEQHDVVSGHRYEWNLFGTTNDGKRFAAMGGFVVNKSSR